MNTQAQSQLREQVDIGGQTYLACLAAAEQAVVNGQFNVAKVLRVIAHAQRAQAQMIARLINDDLDSQGLLSHLGKQLQLSAAAIAMVANTESLGSDVRTQLRQIADAQQKLVELTDRSISSLESNFDVLELDVHLVVFVCSSCGCPVEGTLSDACPICGALAAQFAWFGPYYAGTPERLGLMNPEQILKIMDSTPEELSMIIVGIDDSVLSRKPTPEEWSVKEIAGHMIACEAYFAELIRRLLAVAKGEWADLNPYPIPWLIHEGQGYEVMPSSELAQRFKSCRAQTLALLSDVSAENYSHTGIRFGVELTLLDVGCYIVNHDLGHLAQIRYLCQAKA